MDDRLFSFARVGDVQQIYENEPIPDGWHLMDGTVCRTDEWPDYARAMRLPAGVFQIPAPERIPPGSRFIIKLGERRTS